MNKISIVHYCWFGNKKIPNKNIKYIKKWKKFFKDCKFKKWDETNFNYEDFLYSKEAYKANKMAFVSDVARIYALYNEGGFYLDTDVEVIKSIDNFDFSKAILGVESVKDNTIGTGFMYFQPHDELLYEILQFYKNEKFINEDGTFNIIPNTHFMSRFLLKKYNIKPNEEIQISNSFVLYPFDYFTCFDSIKNCYIITDNTHCIHHFNASWMPLKNRVKGRISRYIKRIKYCLMGNK